VNLLERALQIDVVALLFVLAPTPLRACFRRGSEKYFQLCVGKHDAAYVPPFHHNATLFAGASLLGHQNLTHSGVHGDLGSGLRDFGRTNRGCHIVLIEEYSLRAAFRAQVNARVAGQRHQIIVIAIEGEAVPERLERQRAVHRSGVYVHVTQQLSRAPRQRALARTDRPIYGNNQFLQKVTRGPEFGVKFRIKFANKFALKSV
jgi:hypothetical protein